MAYTPIPNNPYIVGNPIQSSKMFYGRNEDFLYIKDKLEKETKGLIITLAGDRRSGKTSILFQVMNGRLGPDYIPFFVDMQAMAAVESDAQFLERMDACMRQNLDAEIPAQNYAQNCWRAFEGFLDLIAQKYPDKKLVFLIDEYELIEYKIEKNLVSEELITFFANLMENRNVYFVFTGSNKLEERQTLYWKTLFSKSQYRKITFLKHNDCLDLITKPLEGYIVYTEEQQEKIWRLSAGQPFYTQIFCQNMVDRLQMEKRNEVLEEDIDAVIGDIVDNPMPQMIYFWQELEARHKLAMSLLAEVLQEKEDWADSQKLMNTLAAHKLNLAVTVKDIHTALEEMYHRDILSKKGNEYQFRVDIFRFWVKQEQNIWKLLREINLEKPKSSAKPYKFAIAVILAVLLLSAALAFWLLKPKSEFGDTKNSEARKLYKQANAYYEDANYALALKTVKSAIVADSLYFKACLLKADVLKAMNRNDEALSAYQKAERLYTTLAANIGKQIGSIPDSLQSDTTVRNWQKKGDFFILDSSNNVDRYVYWMLPTTDVAFDLAAYNTKYRKWLHLPKAQFLAQQKNLLFYYDSAQNLIGAYDAKKAKIAWTYKPLSLPSKYRFYLAAYNTREWKTRYLTVYNRKGLYVLNAKTGREYANLEFNENEVKFALQDDKAKKLVFSSDAEMMIHKLPNLEKLKAIPRSNGNATIVFSPSASFITIFSPFIGENDYFRFNFNTETLDSLGSTARVRVNFVKWLTNNLMLAHGDSLFIAESGKRTFKPLKLKDNQTPEILHSNHSASFRSNEAFVRGQDDVFMLNTDGKVIYQIPLKNFGEGETIPEPRVFAYDRYRKRIIYTMPVGNEARSDARIIGVYDIRQQKILFSIRASNSYGFIYPYKNLYVLAESTYDYRLFKSNYNLLLMNPESFQLMPYTGLRNLEATQKSITGIKDGRIFTLKSYPKVDERLLQRIHENLILFYDSYQIIDKLQTTFDKMLAYVRNLNNIGVSQAIVKCIVNQAQDDLGYYAGKLKDIDANFSQIKPVLLSAMNLFPNKSFPNVKLSDNEYLDSYGNSMLARKYDVRRDYLTYSLFKDGKPQELYTCSNNVPGAFLAMGIDLFYKNGEKPLLWLWDKQGSVFSYPPPFTKGSRVVMDWLDENSVFYITQKQRGKTFDYELATIGKSTGNTEILSRWNSALSLKATLVYNNKIGMVFTDSLKATYYVPTLYEPPLMQPLSKITALNGKPISSASELNPEAAEDFVLSFLAPNHEQQTIRLSKEQSSSALFADFLSSHLQWFDPKTKSLSSAVDFIKLSPRASDIYIYGATDVANNNYLHTEIWSDISLMQVADINTGHITACGGYGSERSSSGWGWGISWAEKENTGLSFMEVDNPNICNLTCFVLNKAGTISPNWKVSIPWSYAYIFDTTQEHYIVYANRQKPNGDESTALLYINRKTGSIDRRVNILSQTQFLTFDNRPLLFYDPELGFLDPVLPD